MCVEEKEKEEFEEGENIDEYADYVFVYEKYELEPQTCSVCNYNGCGSFYYSSDNMDEPVCATCETKYRETADCSQRIYHDEYRPSSPQEQYKGTYCYYPLSDIRSCSECMYNGAGFFLTDDNKVSVCYDCGEKVSNSDDSEYVPSDEEKKEEDDDDEEDEEDEEYEEDDSEYVSSGEDEDFCDDPHCHEIQDEEDDVRPEKFFGCEGCQYEWRDGWQKGWKAAMKQIKKFAKQQKRPENIRIPECAYCGATHNLKKCTGTCEGAFRYCSLVCQKKDWKEGHKQECWAKL